MLAFAGIGWAPHEHWVRTLAEKPHWFILPCAEILIIALLSPEAQPAGLWRRIISRKRVLPPCATLRARLDGSLEMVRTSEVYKRLAQYLSEQPDDYWRDGCWHFFTFPGHYDGRPVQAVFAVPLSSGAGPVRGALVHPDRDEIFPALPLGATITAERVGM